MLLYVYAIRHKAIKRHYTMITKFDAETATIIIPGASYALFSKIERLNSELGAYVLVEVDYNTANFTKLDIDYSLVEYDSIADAEQEINNIYAYIRKFFNITTEVDAEAWTAESDVYLAEVKAENIAFYKDWIAEIQAEVPGKRYTQEQIDAKIASLTSKLNLELAA